LFFRPVGEGVVGSGGVSVAVLAVGALVGVLPPVAVLGPGGGAGEELGHHGTAVTRHLSSDKPVNLVYTGLLVVVYPSDTIVRRDWSHTFGEFLWFGHHKIIQHGDYCALRV